MVNVNNHPASIRALNLMFNVLLPKSLFTLSKMFLIPAAGGIPGALKTRLLGSAESGIQSAYHLLRQD